MENYKIEDRLFCKGPWDYRCSVCWNTRLKKSKESSPIPLQEILDNRTGDFKWLSDADRFSLLFKGQPLESKSYDFDVMYLFGIFFRYLWAWFHKSKNILKSIYFYDLHWNVNNLLDIKKAMFIGIDGSGIGRNCGFLDELRNHFILSKGDKAEVMVYLFVTEISFAVYYTKQMLELSMDYDLRYKRYIFYDAEGQEFSEPNIPFIYGFLIGLESTYGWDYSCVWSLKTIKSLKDSDLNNYKYWEKNPKVEKIENLNFWQTNLFPTVILDKYITNLAEAEVFLFFLRTLACMIGGSFKDLLFSQGKKWYENFVYKDGFYFIRYITRMTPGQRKGCFDFCVEMYKKVLEESLKFTGNEKKDEGIGIWWKISMTLKVVGCLFYVRVYHSECSWDPYVSKIDPVSGELKPIYERIWIWIFEKIADFLYYNVLPLEWRRKAVRPM